MVTFIVLAVTFVFMALSYSFGFSVGFDKGATKDRIKITGSSFPRFENPPPPPPPIDAPHKTIF